MNEYTIDSENIYFLNDKNIAANTDVSCKAGFNAVPSHKLFVEKYKELSAYDNSLCGEISTANVNLNDFKDEVIKLSDDLSGTASEQIKEVSGYVDTTVKGIGSVERTTTYQVFEKIGIDSEKKLCAEYRTLTTSNISGLDSRLATTETSVGILNSNINQLSYKLDSCETSCTQALTKYEYCVPKNWVVANAGENNKIITQDELKKFDNTFRFAGMVSSDPTSWANPLSGEGRTYSYGDIVLGKAGISAVDGKEWLLYLSANPSESGVSASIWEEIGSQNTYATKAELQTEVEAREKADKWLSATYLQTGYKAREDTFGGIKIGYDTDTANKNYAVSTDNDGNAYVHVPWKNTTYTAGEGISISSNEHKISISAEYLKKWNSLSTYAEISSQLSNNGYALSSDVSSKTELNTEFKKCFDNDEYLSTAIDNKIKVGNYGEDLVNQTELSVVKIADKDYHKLVAEEKLNPDVVYVVSSEILNAYDERIINVGEALSATDAVNLSGMTSAISALSNEISSNYALSSDVSADIYNITSSLYNAVSEYNKFNDKDLSNSVEIGEIVELLAKMICTLSNLNKVYNQEQ